MPCAPPVKKTNKQKTVLVYSTTIQQHQNFDFTKYLDTE